MFTQLTFDFLADLAANNRKDWFDANRDNYEAYWKAPALDFIAAVAEGMARLDPPLQAAPRLNGSLRRINRDVRFSKDKSPYNARLHMIFWAGAHPNRSPGFHIVLDPDGVGHGSGMWGFEGAVLARYRERLMDPSDADALIAALDMAAGTGATLDEPALKTLPKGFAGDGRVGELLRQKGVVARTHDARAAPATIIGAGGPDWALKLAETHAPLIRWLAAL